MPTWPDTRATAKITSKPAPILPYPAISLPIPLFQNNSLTHTQSKDGEGLSPATTAASGANRAEAATQEAFANEIAEASGVGKRRTQVILHLLREGKVLRRTRRGYGMASEPPNLDTLTQILEVYTTRAQQDKDRLAEMMHYAETVDCRVQVIREYFGEDRGEPCDRCDNCVQRAANSSVEMAQEQLSRASWAREAPAANAAPEVTRIETMHGTIVTTAPETLPHAEEGTPKFQPGSRVRHKRFGEGKIKDAYGDVALVHFPKVGEKKLKTTYLSAA
jgi:ATP-dependent DNA helicase RecQ